MATASEKIKRLTIGVTGGAGSGKSEVARIFRGWGARVINADRLGHDLLRPGSPCYKNIVSRFGPGMLSAGGRIDRRKLGALVFGDRSKRRALNRMVHPELVRRIKGQMSRVKREGCGPALVDAALIVDWGLQDWLDFLIAVEAPTKLRVERLLRKGMSLARIRGIMSAQLPAGRLREAADMVIDNSGDIRRLRERARAAWDRMAETA